MGNHNVRFGGMIIDFERPYYYPGDIVRGYIHMNIAEAFETRGLELKFKIKEYVKWHETEYKTETKREFDKNLNQWRDVTHSVPVKVERKEKKTLYKNSTVIATMMNNMLGFGQYSYPFQFALPNHLPGSFEYYDEDIVANIKYIVTATAISWLGKEFNLEAQSILVVRQPSTNFDYPSQLSDTKSISTWCFFSKGTSSISASFPKNNFCQDESVQVTTQLSNTQCTLNCTCIKLQLLQRIILRVNGKDHFHGDTKYLNRIVSERRYDGIYPAGQESQRTLELQLSDSNNPTYRHINKCKHKHLFRDPNLVSKLQATVKSRLIECSYVLRVTTEFDSCTCCSGVPTIDLPVILYVPETMYDMNVFRPQNWNPVLMPVYEFSVPTAEQLGINNGIMNVNIQTNFQGGTNINVNSNMGGNVPNSGGMIQTSYEPMQNNQNVNMNVNVNQGGMMTGGVQPMQGGMMVSGTEPMQGGMMTGGVQPMQGGMMVGGNEPMQEGMMVGGTEPMQGGMMTGGVQPMQAELNLSEH